MAKQRLVKKGSQYGILDEASNTVLPISGNMKLVQKQGQYGVLDGDSVIPIDNFSESITDSDLDILKKKNSTVSVGQPVQEPGSSVSQKMQGSGLSESPAKQRSGQLLISGPSASFNQPGNRLPSAAPLKEPELPSTQGEIFRAQPKPKPYNLKDKAWLEKNPVLWNSKQQIDEWENVKRNLEGGTKAAIGAIDYAFFGPLAADWAEHIVYSGAGLNEDYNKLSPEAKKIVKETVRGNAGMVGQTALGQEKLADFWFKESEKVLNTAIKREGDALTDMANFVEHPSVDSAKNLIYRGIESTAQTLPYMAATALTGGSAGLILAGGMAAAEDARTQEKETGNRGLGYLLSNAYTGIAEGYFEKYTQGLLKKAGSLVKGDVKAAENLAKGFVESITEDFGVEGISEGLTTLTQELASKLALGEEIDGWDIARKVADATILGEFSGTGISVAGQTAGRGVQKSKEAINNYLATKLLTADQEQTITNNTNTINELRTQVSSPETSPAVKAIANKKIAELEAENKGIKDQLYTAAEKLNVKGSVLLVGLDKALRSNRKEAEEIINDPSIDDPTKKLLLQDLLDEHNGLKQQKDALQKQTTDEISFQPEAGVSGEMAEGVPQAEPQGPTEEGQVEEVVAQTPEVEVEELGKTPTPEVEQAAKKSGVPVTGIWSMFKENKKTFGLNNAQALASAVVMDRIVGTIAKRSGKTKEQVYKSIDFKKGNINRLPKDVLFQKAEKINAPKENINKAVNEIVSMGELSPMGDRNIFMPNGTIVEVSNFDGSLYISSIMTPVRLRGQGLATETMSAILDIASKNNVPVTLTASPFGKQKDLTQKQLTKWYKSLGFKELDYGTLQKEPSSLPQEAVVEGSSINVEPVEQSPKEGKPKLPKNVKLVKPENFFLDAEYDVVVDGEVIGNIYYDKSSKTWNDPNYDRSGEKPYSYKWIYGEILGETKEEAVNELISRYQQSPESIKFQKNEGTARGAMRIAANGRSVIYALTDPNVSTPLHELAHVYENYLTDEEKAKVLSWSGQKEWTRETSENFARGFEKYLSEGKAPTTALKQIFEQFKEWLLDIYKGIKDSEIDVKLNDNMQKIYDAMLSQKEAPVRKGIFAELDKGIEAEDKFDEVYKKRFEKTKDKLKAFGSARTALLKTDAYAAATRQQRLDMLSYLRNKYKLKMDTNLEATRAQMETSKQNTPEEIIATIKDYLSKAIQEGAKRGVKRTKEFFKEKRKAEKQLLSDTIEKVKKMIDKSSLKPSQAKAILNGLKLNLSNEKTMARYMERVDKIMKNVKYAEKLNEANDLKGKIKKLISDRNIAAQNQLARDFLTLSPDLSKNIDKYIEVANSVYDAIKRGQRTPAVIEDVEAYVSKAQAYEKELIKNTLEDIAEKAKAKLLKENQNLVDAGVLNADMTIDQINEYLYSINNLGEDNVEQAKEKKKLLLEQAKNVFESLAPIAEMMVSEGIDPFTGEEIEIDKSTKDLINRLLDVDLDKISGAEAYRLVNSLQEFLVNGVVDDLEARLDAYEAPKEAERLEKKGVKSTISTSKFMPLAFISKLWDINIKPLKSLLAKAFNGRIAGTEIFNSSGLRGVSLGAARAKKIASIIISKYDKMFKDRRPNGKAFDDASNTYERGIFAFLSRNINKATPEQTKAEFNRRMKLIGETIDNLRDTNKRDLIAMADVIDSIYSKIKKFGEEGSTEGSIEDVAKFIDPINQEAVNYWVEEFKNYYPEIKSVARTTYNTILEDDVDYTPDVFFRIVPDEKAYEPSGVLKMASSLVKTKRSGSLLENKRTQSIRDVEDPTSNNLGVSFDFDLNMANTFQKTLVDIKTAPSILYFKNFVNSAAFNRMVPDSEVRKVLKDRMGSYADSIREKDGSNYEDIVKEADAIVRRISRYSTQRALGSISNIAKQTIPIFVNTFVNLNGSGDIAIFREGLRSISDPDIQKAIDESGYPIANRGLESQTSLDSADKLLKKANLNDKKSIFETIDELGQKRLESFLKKPDVYAARAAWVSYYLQEQKRKGVDINRIDWSQPLDSESANYAEDMVDLQQNTSESSSMGKLFSSRAPGTSLVRQFLFGYASFVMNQKDKVYTDVGILFSNSNKQEKEVAVKSLISTVAEMAAFEFVSMALSEVTMAIASSLVGGDDEDKETMMDRFNRIFKRSYTNMTASLLSPAPLLDRVVIYLLNQGITGATNLFPKEKEKKKKGDKKKDENFFYEDKGYATSPVTSALSYIGGAPGVAVRAGMSAFNNIQRIFASQYQDVFGNDVKFSNEDKAIIAAAFAFQILAAGNLLPSEADRIANSIVIEVEKGARKSKKKKWSPM